jgi:hypothetical protein
MYLPSSAPIRAFKRQVVTAAVKRFTKPITGPVVVEIDMQAWGPFAAKFAGPMLKKD